jgi:Xaa-Pro aminopeptidase
MTKTRAEKLSALRTVLAKEGVDGFIIPRADEYQGEYVSDSANRLHWISGFTGSAGVSIVLKNKAAVLSDGRYTIQLKQQIDAGLFETGDSTVTSAADWMAANAGKDFTLGYDPRLHTPREIKIFEDKGLTLKPLAVNPVDSIWEDRPPTPSAKVELFPMASAGVSAQDKLDQAAEQVRAKKCDAAILALPDSIAWLLNVRSNDIPHIPVALSYAIVRADGTLDWFIDEKRVPEAVRTTFGNRVMILPPDYIGQSLKALAGKKVLVDGRRTSVWFTENLKKHGAEIVDAKDPVIALKARKNKAEQESMRRAHVRDGVALVKFLKWFSKEAVREMLTEMDVEAKLEEFRREAPEYRDSSFDTIAGFGPNGAIVHYRATEETNARIERWNMLLLDSGAQYSDGTTDITRTIAVGEPTPEMKEHFTLVLKGHIAVATARFPQGTTGAQIDALARAPLWQRNLDYAHGTGHGVGCYLSVHEEAASLSTRGYDPIEAGMIISNEPGFYKEGAYGIRIENLLLVHEDGVCEATGKPMLAFETLTFAPIDKSLVVAEMLSPDEQFWLANYHKQVLAELSPYLDPAMAEWLRDHTR